MRSVRYHEYGPPSVLTIEDAPEPHAPDGAVRIRVQAVSVNVIDWKVRKGLFRANIPIEFPVIPGRDAVGVVDEVGRGARGVAIGDTVFGLGGLQDTFAEYAVLTAWAAPPPRWTPAEAASAGLAVGTACPAVAALDPQPGQTVLIEGATGAVGLAAVAFALDRGATVVGTARRANHQRLADLGVVPVEYGPGLRERVAAVAPQGVDAALDTAGAGSLDELVAIAGGPSHAVTVTDDVGAARLGVRLIFGENDSTMMAAAAALGAAGRYTPWVVQEFAIEDVVAAHVRAEQGSGKIALRGFAD